MQCQKIFTNYPYDKELITRTYKELEKLNAKEIKLYIKKWGNEMNRHFPKEET